MWIGNGSIISAERERNRMRIKNYAQRKGLLIGVVVSKTFHPKECVCWGCLTHPGSFFPFPEEHRKFVDALFRAVNQQ